MDDWLVSVEKDNKIVELYYSEELHDIDTIRAIHRGCNVEAVQIAVSTSARNKKSKCDTKLLSKRVRCIETGDIYPSSLDCADALGISRWNIYKSIQRGIATRGLHFKYID